MCMRWGAVTASRAVLCYDNAYNVSSPQVRYMKYIADVMLGRLATWLRLMGYDVFYDHSLDDRSIIRIARDQDRVIITRDTGLMRQKAVRGCIFIMSDHLLDQLEEMKQCLDGSDAASQGRCARCNGELEIVGANDDVRDCVPEHVFHAYHRFLQCRICRQVYWEGSHYRHIRETLRQVTRQEL